EDELELALFVFIPQPNICVTRDGLVQQWMLSLTLVLQISADLRQSRAPVKRRLMCKTIGGDEVTGQSERLSLRTKFIRQHTCLRIHLECFQPARLAKLSIGQ